VWLPKELKEQLPFELAGGKHLDLRLGQAVKPGSSKLAERAAVAAILGEVQQGINGRAYVRGYETAIKAVVLSVKLVPLIRGHSHG